VHEYILRPIPKWGQLNEIGLKEKLKNMGFNMECKVPLKNTDGVINLFSDSDTSSLSSSINISNISNISNVTVQPIDANFIIETSTDNNDEITIFKLLFKSPPENNKHHSSRVICKANQRIAINWEKVDESRWVLGEGGDSCAKACDDAKYDHDGDNLTPPKGRVCVGGISKNDQNNTYYDDPGGEYGDWNVTPEVCSAIVEGGVISTFLVDKLFAPVENNGNCIIRGDTNSEELENPYQKCSEIFNNRICKCDF